jgi:hypothetical protein
VLDLTKKSDLQSGRCRVACFFAVTIEMGARRLAWRWQNGCKRLTLPVIEKAESGHARRMSIQRRYGVLLDRPVAPGTASI